MSARQLDWRIQAVESLRVILEHIGEHNLDAAKELFGEICKRLKLVTDFPNLYRASARVEGLREIVVTANYVVPYRITPDAVQVVDVVHARRNWPDPSASALAS